jgi:ubiquinone/menaquinone biosynthesis C-methylase UbiE
MQAVVNESRFNIIAQSYEWALATYPDARRDGDWLLQQLRIHSDDIILEVAAGTGFLTGQIARHNPEGILYVQDIAPRTLEINRSKWGDFEHIQYKDDLATIPDNSCDKAVSLGGWHHMEDQIAVTQGVLGKLKDGGIFCVGDFADHSSIQRYFDEVVDGITTTGHQALFPSVSRLVNLGRFAKARGTTTAAYDVPFTFDTKEGVGLFFQKVFALDQRPQDTLADIERIFEIREVPEGWSVMVPYVYAVFQK